MRSEAEVEVKALTSIASVIFGSGSIIFGLGIVWVGCG